MHNDLEKKKSINNRQNSRRVTRQNNRNKFVEFVLEEIMISIIENFPSQNLKNTSVELLLIYEKIT